MGVMGGSGRRRSASVAAVGEVALDDADQYIEPFIRPAQGSGLFFDYSSEAEHEVLKLTHSTSDQRDLFRVSSDLL